MTARRLSSGIQWALEVALTALLPAATSEPVIFGLRIAALDFTRWLTARTQKDLAHECSA